MKNRVRLALVAVVGAVVLVVGGTWVYLNVLRDPPPARLTLAPAPDDGATSTSLVPPAAEGATAATGADGAWKITSGSEAGYRVPEVLNGQSTEAVGRTSGVTGGITIEGTEVTAGRFTVDMTSVVSDESRRDNQFRGRIMNVAAFPTSTFTLTAPLDFGTIPADEVRLTAAAKGRLTLKGVTRDVSFSVEAQRSGTTIRVAGSIPVTFADFGIENPSAGPARVGDDGELEFLLVLTS